MVSSPGSPLFLLEHLRSGRSKWGPLGIGGFRSRAIRCRFWPLLDGLGASQPCHRRSSPFLPMCSLETSPQCTLSCGIWPDPDRQSGSRPGGLNRTPPLTQLGEPVQQISGGGGRLTRMNAGERSRQYWVSCTGLIPCPFPSEFTNEESCWNSPCCHWVGCNPGIYPLSIL